MINLDAFIGVNSYLELFTTLLGWILYDKIYNILTDTGLIFIPFLALLIRGFLLPIKDSGDYGDAKTIKHSVMFIELSMLLMLIAAVFTFVPAMKLSLNSMNFFKPNLECEFSNGTYTKPASINVQGDNTGTVYDGSFSMLGGTVAKVPVFWVVIMSISSAITSAAVESIPCTLDYRRISVELEKSKINDPGLVHRLVNFYRDCFLVSAGRAVEDYSNNGFLNGLLQSEPEVDWIGAQVLVDNYYPLVVPESPNADFHYDPNINPADASYVDYGNGGHPTCAQIWQHPTKGLRKKILDSYNQSSLGWFQKFKSDYTSTAAFEDSLIRETLNVSDKFQIAATSYSADLGELGTFNKAMAKVRSDFTAMGAQYQSLLGFGAQISALKGVMPYIQSLILMVMYISLSVLLLISSFSGKLIFTASVSIFSVKFCTFWWALAFTIDNKIQSSNNSVAITLDTMRYGNELAKNSTLVDLVSVSTYLLFPVLWFAVIAWVGVSMSAFGQAVNNNPANAAINSSATTLKATGEKIASIATTVATRGLGRGK